MAAVAASAAAERSRIATRMPNPAATTARYVANPVCDDSTPTSAINHHEPRAAEPLPVRAHLEAHHRPKAFPLELRRQDVPLVPEEDVDGVAVDEPEETYSKHDVGCEQRGNRPARVRGHHAQPDQHRCPARAGGFSSRRRAARHALLRRPAPAPPPRAP